MQKRHYYGLKTKNTIFAKRSEFAVIRDGIRYCGEKIEAALEWASMSGVEVIYLLDRFTDLTRDFFMASGAWSLVSYNHEYRSGVYRKDGIEKSVKWAGTWFDFDPETVTREAVTDAWQRVNYWLGKRSSGQIPAMSTPGQSGLRLLETCLPAGFNFTPPDAPLCELIRANTPQARKEILKASIDDIRGSSFSYLDARWAYAACAKIELPGELQIHYVADQRAQMRFSQLPFDTRYWKGWARAIVTSPSDWRGPGLVPVKLPSGRYTWPNDLLGEEVVITAREAEEADRLGWIVDVREAWKFSIVRPLRVWAEKLIDMRELESDQYYRSAIRNIMLNAIGAMYSDSFSREGGVSFGQFAEKAETMTRAQRLSAVRVGDQMRYVERVQKEGQLLNYYMPHWVAYIWAECRVRLAREMMKYDPQQIIGCNLDAVYLQGESFGEDDGKIGTFRLKGILRADEISELFETDCALDWNSLETLKEQAEANLSRLTKGVAYGAKQ